VTLRWGRGEAEPRQLAIQLHIELRREMLRERVGEVVPVPIHDEAIAHRIASRWAAQLIGQINEAH